MAIQENKNVFMYGWCGFTGDVNAAKVNSIIKTFPFLVNQINKSVTTKDCKFGLEKEKESTARIVLFKELNIINSYTLEASFYKSEFKSMWKVKSEMDKDNSKFLSNGGRKINGSSDDAFDDHFEEIDFINVGRDFVKALSNAASNSVLK